MKLPGSLLLADSNVQTEMPRRCLNKASAGPVFRDLWSIRKRKRITCIT
jgi:hypothetical protein